VLNIGEVHFSGSVNDTLTNVTQDTISILSSRRILLVHTAWKPPKLQALSCRAAFHLGVPQHVMMPMVALPQLQDSGLLLVEFCEVSIISQFLQCVKAPLHGPLVNQQLSQVFQGFSLILSFAPE